MVTDYFKQRRTVREYTNQEVDDALLYGMLDDAMRAPTTGNMQLYSVVVTRSEEGKKRLAPMHFNQPAVLNAPVLLTFCGDFNRFVKWCEVSNAQPGYDNFQSFIAALLDVAIFAQQFNTIAEMNGLGCCYIGTTTYNASDIAKALELPARVVPVITLTLGYPKGNAVQVERLPLAAIVHKERYSDYTSEQIRELYHDKELLPENRRFVEENGKQTLAQVFTDVRYTKANNEVFSKLYYDFIAAQHFAFPK